MPETPFFDQAAPAASRGRTMPDRLDGTVALVTGASSGIGAATSITLAAEGAAVAVAARRKDRLEDLASGIREQGGTVLVLESDITDGMQPMGAEDIADMIAYIVTRPRHVAVNEVLIRPTEQA